MVYKRPVKAIEAFRETIHALRKIGIPGPEKEAELIFKELLLIDPVRLYRDNPKLSAEQTRQLKDALKRRKYREPIQYIIGHVSFYGLKILVGPGVLIPRPETELLVHEALKKIKKANPKILDLCTGTGAIALALAKNLPGSDVTGVDISEAALSWAEKNRVLNGIENARFLKGDLFAPVKGIRFDLITANPPYIKGTVMKELAPEIKDWEPEVALTPGPEGLEIIEKIIASARDYLMPGAPLLIEIAGGTDPEILKGLAETSGLRFEAVLKDYAGMERIFMAKRRADKKKGALRPPFKLLRILKLERINKEHYQDHDQGIDGQGFYHRQTDDQSRGDLSRSAGIPCHTFAGAAEADTLADAGAQSRKTYAYGASKDGHGVITDLASASRGSGSGRGLISSEGKRCR